MRRLTVLLFFAALLLVAQTWAGTPLPIHFTASGNPNPAHPSEVVTVTVKATVAPGWHIYSVVPAANGPAATEIMSLPDAMPVGPTTEDAPQSQFDPNFGRQVAFHENSATFTRQFRLLPQSNSGEHFVTLHYQTCNDRICLPPTDAVVSIDLTVSAGAVRPQYAPPAPNNGGARISASFPTPSSPAPQNWGGGASLLVFLFAALGAGLLALVTPCVFPLIPITLTNFVKQANGNKKKLVQLSGGYALGIVALYVALGVIVTATVGATGINKVAANPWVNLGIFIVFVVFALSFFETVQIQFPANLSALQTTARSHSGTLGLVLLGVTFVLASFTCTAPLIGTLLVAASQGERLRPLLGTLAFALAFVSPFLIFALFPQWIARIPKSGVWLARVKAVLGFLELAAALKFLSNADRVWQWKLLTEPVLLAAWAIIFICAALYLWGTLRFGVVAETEGPGVRVSPSRAAFAALFLGCAGYCFWGLAGRPLNPYVGAFLPPAGYGNVAAAANGLPWLTSYDAALVQAKAEGKPVLIDFTGYTCTNCLLNEKNVFPRPEVQTALANYVRVQLYTDGGKDGPNNQALEQEKFGDVALPLYGIVNAQTGMVVDKIAGVLSPASFTHFLSRPIARSLPAPQNWGGGAGGPALAPWTAYSPQTFAQAKQSGKPILIDFTAAWCVNCKEIEHDVFDAPAVAPALARDFVTLRADLTQWNSPASIALQKQYGLGSLPTIVILDSRGQEMRPLRITGRLPITDFQSRLTQAMASR